jgi:peptidoglycan/xylan/chitin deacetylase (PgdA/CDA1 family)
VQIPLSILIYRRIGRSADPLLPDEIDAHRFEQHLRLLKRWFHVLPLDHAVQHLRERSLPSRAACLTFEHGYAEHAEVVLPLLVRHRLTATFFVATAYLDGGCMWQDAVLQVVRAAPGKRLNLTRSGFGSYAIGHIEQRRAVLHMLLDALGRLPQEERLERVRSMARRFAPAMLSADQLLALHRAGMDIGAQTVHCTPLASLSNAEARSEIAEGRAALQELIQAPVRFFAYPEGRHGEHFARRHVNMLRTQGFDGAVTTSPGAARFDTDPFLLPRFTPWDRSSSRFLLRMASNLFTAQA